MSAAQFWAALQQSAMVGVGRVPMPEVFRQMAPAGSSGSQQLLQAALVQPAASAATQLLRASAVAAVLERAGWLPGFGVQLKASLQPPEAAPEEVRAAPDDRPLLNLLREVLSEGPSDMLEPTLCALDCAGQRLPPELLVDALEQGRQSVALRAWLIPVLGERGRWLAAQNPSWRYASGVEEQADAEVVWQDGSIEQRLALLRAERASDPDKARLRLESALKELSAKERLPMVQSLVTGLSLADEALLEKLLADRSKDVREAAAQLLSSLPGSAYGQRLSARVASMLSQDASGEWQLEPPEQGDKDWERDGIALQPPAYFKGVKAWLLQQCVELTPLQFWTETLGKTPQQLWEWSKRSDWKTALRQGWLAAVRTQRDVRWLDVLYNLGRDGRTDTLLPLLMEQLNDSEREALWRKQLLSSQGRLVAVLDEMGASLAPAAHLSEELSILVVDALNKALNGPQVIGDWYSYQADRALLACARMLHLSQLERLADLWRKTEPEAVLDEAEASKLTPDQRAKLERSRRRPWDDERVRTQLIRSIALRQALHQVLGG